MSRICVVRQLYFPLDGRLRREVDALILAGHEVDVVCIRRPGEASYEHDGLLTVRRLPLQHQRGASLVRYLFEYAAFLVAVTTLVGALHLRRRYDLIQVNTPPDTLVFTALVPRLLGTRVLLDLYEPMPEFFASKFKVKPSHPSVRLMSWLEQISIRFASRAITSTDQMRQAFVARGARDEKVDVVLNTADEAIWDSKRYPPRPREPGRFVLISHGTVEERYGLDTVIRAVALLKAEIPGLRLEIFGEGSYLPELRRLVSELEVEDQVYISGQYVPLDELLQAIAAADAGVVAMKRDPFRDLTHCLKMFDFIAMRKPAIVSRTRSVEEYFDESCFQLFRSDDPHDLARAIRELHADQGLGERLVRHADSVNEPYRWPQQREFYQGLVRCLVTASPSIEQEVVGGVRVPEASQQH